MFNFPSKLIVPTGWHSVFHIIDPQYFFVEPQWWNQNSETQRITQSVIELLKIKPSSPDILNQNLWCQELKFHCHFLDSFIVTFGQKNVRRHGIYAVSSTRHWLRTKCLHGLCLLMSVCTETLQDNESKSCKNPGSLCEDIFLTSQNILS